MCVDEKSPRAVLTSEDVHVNSQEAGANGGSRFATAEEATTESGTRSRKESKQSSFDIEANDGDTEPQLPFSKSKSATDRPVVAHCRDWETSRRKKEIRSDNAPINEDRSYRFWEVKMHKGQLDNLLDVAKKSWVLDKVAAVPSQFVVSQNRTFWEVKHIPEVQVRARGSSVPARLSARIPAPQPESDSPAGAFSGVMPMRTQLETCERSEENILMSLYDVYFANPVLESGGRTVMVHDLLNKFALEDVLGVLDDLDAQTVEYIFLPLSEWETKKSKLREPRKARNKAYCFVHFADVDACENFVQRLETYEFPNDTRSSATMRCKRMSASLAASQGVVRNLLRLMDLCNRKWHPRAGSLAIKLEGSLSPVNVASFRKMLLQSRKARHNPALFMPEP
jgi:hypothetical protein